jgi:hypothetical protein
MKLNDYKAGDCVEVLINNPKNNNQLEWRKAEVLDVRMIYPRNGEQHKPYPIAIVRVTRTYCKANPIYRMIVNIPVFVDNHLEFYDNENDEGIIYEKDIRLIV